MLRSKVTPSLGSSDAVCKYVNMLLAIERQQANSGFHPFVARDEAKGSMRRWPADADVTGHYWSENEHARVSGNPICTNQNARPCWQRPLGGTKRARTRRTMVACHARIPSSQAGVRFRLTIEISRKSEFGAER